MDDLKCLRKFHLRCGKEISLENFPRSAGGSRLPGGTNCYQFIMARLEFSYAAKRLLSRRKGFSTIQ